MEQGVVFALLVLVMFHVNAFVPMPNMGTSLLGTRSRLGMFNILGAFNNKTLLGFSVLTVNVVPCVATSVVIRLLRVSIIPGFAR